MKHINLFILLFFFSASNIFAQVDVEINKGDYKIKEKKIGFKEGWQSIKKGDEFFKLGTKFYKDALNFYLDAQKYNPNVAALNYKIGICYLNSFQKQKSIEYFENAITIDEFVTPDIHYFLARAYQYNYRFEDAIGEYNEFKLAIPLQTLKAFEERVISIDKLINECKNGIELKKKPVRVELTNLGEQINTIYPEYCPVISTDEETLVFTTRRKDGTGNEVDVHQQYAEDLYIAKRHNNKWYKAQNMGKPINTKNHDATVSISADGQTLYIYRDNNIYQCKLKGEEWSKPKPLSKAINSKYHEPSASVSADGRTIYFVSNRPDGNFGKHDIYYAKLNANGEFENPKNIGNVINTQENEDAVFIHPDGNTLYFSSQGHNTMGGYDIFKTVKDENGNWSKPENLGYPINTPDDDIYFVLAANGRNAYFSSTQKDGFGKSDIYMLTFIDKMPPLLLSTEENLLASSENQVKVQTSIMKKIPTSTFDLTILKGIVRDSITREPLGSEIEIYDNEKNEVFAILESNSSTGKYLLSLPSGRNYGIRVQATDYLFHSENVNIPKNKGYLEINKDIDLLKFTVGAKIVLRNIFFDTAKFDLRGESTPELKKLFQVLIQYPTLKIEISGHTDNVGSLDYNKNLSNNRAKQVVEFLIENGIEKERLIYVGYAYLQPIDTNDTPEGRQNNRRVEFKIIAK